MRKFLKASIVCLHCLPAAAVHGQVGVPRAPEASVAAGEYVRLGRDEAGMPVSLQTSIVRFRPAAGAESVDLAVDLVGAVHIADVGYYEELNARFRDYDTVLYELVAPEGTRVPLGGGERIGMVSGIQGTMAQVLDLAFQLEHIDYTRPNLIHSDLSPADISQNMAERGDSAAEYLLRALAVSMNEYARDPQGIRSMGLLLALFSTDRARLLKLQLATLLLETETSTELFEGEEGSSLIGERNKRAVNVLRERVRSGDRRIAIFFGAAHLSGIAELIESDLGLRADETTWLDAWDLR
jgi:hypothetical protein